jgi:4-diphosphocytidyl-2-C-methyl-D-erythritol kinase
MITHPHVKVNLGLSVLRRRPDGYHDIETLFVPYHGLSDTLEIIVGDDWSETSASLFARYAPSEIAQAIAPDGSQMVTLARRGGVDWDPLKDLTARAYALLAADFKLPPMKIFLEKTAPVGAGLGGGSSDAAFALRMVAELAGLDLGDEALAAYAARLGSDCAFFVYDSPMFGEGRGEILTPYDLDLSAFDLQVIVPEGISVSTAEAYRGIVPREGSAPRASEGPESGSTEAGGQVAAEAIPRRVKNSGLCGDLPARREPPIPLREALSKPVGQWRDCLVNDFEATVFAAHPELAALKSQLYADGALYASMSGSGSALFALRPAAKK